MSKLRRLTDERTVYFITNVTYRRNNILINNRDLYRRSMNNTIKKCDLDLIAWVVLPDHFHVIIDFRGLGRPSALRWDSYCTKSLSPQNPYQPDVK